MYIETDRLIIRDMELSDEPAYVEMASDGSLDEDIFAGCSNKSYIQKFYISLIDAEE